MSEFVIRELYLSKIVTKKRLQIIWEVPLWKVGLCPLSLTMSELVTALTATWLSLGSGSWDILSQNPTAALWEAQ